MLARLTPSSAVPGRPLAVWVVDYGAPQPLDSDLHESFEVGIVLSGKQEWCFEEATFVLDTGDVWLTTAWEPHGWRILERATRNLVLIFLPEVLGEQMIAGRPWLDLFAVDPRARPRATTGEARQELLVIGREMVREVGQQRAGWVEAVRLGLIRTLLAVGREWEQPPHDRGPHLGRTIGVDRIMPAIRLLQSEPDRRIACSEAAAACGLSVSRFGYVFRHSMGTSFGRFTLRARLAHAAALLMSTELSVETVAQKAGFVDGSHLHRVFPKYYGLTPAQYRAREPQGL